jgi:hypothetical protein
MSHELEATFTAHTDEGGFTVKEWECGGKYIITGRNPNYCPECGNSL